MRTRYCLLVFCLLSAPFTTAFGQKSIQDSCKALLSSVSKYQGQEPDKALAYADTLKRFSKAHQLWHEYIEAHIWEAQVYALKANWKIAQKTIDEAEHLIRVYGEFLNYEEQSTLKADVYPRQLLIASLTNDYKRLEKLIQEGLKLLKNKVKTHSDSSIIQGAFYYQYLTENARGNITEALRQYDYYKQYLKNNDLSVGNILNYTNYAQLRLDLKQYATAELNFMKAAAIAEQTKTLTGWQLNYNHLLNKRISFYIKNRHFSQADSCLRLLKAQILRGSDIFIKAAYVQLEGDFYKAQNQLDKAALAYTAALNYNLNIYKQGNVVEQKKQNNQIAQSYLDIATVRQKQKRFAEAIKAINNGFTALDPTFYCDDYRDNPNVDKIINRQAFLKLLDCKTGILLDWAAAQPLQYANYQAVAYRTAKEGIDVIESIRKSFTNDYDKQYLLELMYPLYEKGISAAFQLYEREHNREYLTRAFEIFERSKAATLLQAIRTGQAEDELETNDRYTLLDYRDKMAKLENSLHEALSNNQKDESDPSVSQFKRQLDSLKIQLEGLTKTFELKYPNYYRLKYSRPYAPLTDVQKALPMDESTVLFEYFVGEKAIYIFAVSNGRIKLFKQPKPQDFEALVRQFHYLLQTPKGGNIQEYTQMAHQFYALIWQPPLSIFPKKPRKVVIVADGLLCLLPFDGLLTSMPMANLSYRTLPYLIHDHTLLYAYSANAYLEKRTPNYNRQRSVFAGFAPEYPTNSPFEPLPNSIDEINQLASLLRGDKFIGKASREKQFKDIAPYYRCLHLSMHTDMAEVNPMFTKLVFQPDSNDYEEDNLLTPNEIYKLHLNADLVVLSACETGLGELSSGEGAMSFARAFQYAGVPNTVMSLWVADDQASKNVMIQFYKNLKDGQSKEEAMRNAKLEYLSRTKTEDEAFPFFWLTYNIIGNETAIDLSPSLSILWVFGGTFAFCFLVLGVRKRRL